MASATNDFSLPPDASVPRVTPVVIFDLGSVRFRFGAGRRSASVHTATGEHLAHVPATPSQDTSVVAYRALQKAMTATRLLRVDAAGDVSGYGIGFYNPFTGHISVHLDGAAVVFVPDRPLEVPAVGLTTAAVGLPGSRELELGGGVRERALDAIDAARCLAAYA